MMDFNITDEEINALKRYKEKNYEAMNQMLVSDAETDIALLSEDVEKKVVTISYDRESIIEYLKDLKLIYKLILKNHYGKRFKIFQKRIYRGTNLSEIERIKSELYIDRMLSSTENEEDAVNVYSAMWNRPAFIYILLEKTIPFIVLNDVLKEKKYKNEIIISPFTKVKFIEEDKEKKIEKNSKAVKVYNVELEKQELDALTERERNGLYQYILENAYSIKRKLLECIELEKENAINFENVRKLEQLLSKYEIEIEEKESSDSEVEIDYDDIERIQRELAELKKLSTSMFEIRKEYINFINMWKRNIAVYMIAECREIENMFVQDTEDNEDDKEEKQEDIDLEKVDEPEIAEEKEIEGETKEIESSEESLEENEKEDIEKELEEDEEDVEDKLEENTNKEIEEVSNEIIEEIKEKPKAKLDLQETKIVKLIKDTVSAIKGGKEKTEKEELPEEFVTQVKNECNENIEMVKKLQEDIKELITKQQNHAKIAGNMGSVYSALNNAFEMKKVTIVLLDLVEKIAEKVNDICENDEENKKENLEKISSQNIQKSTLINYLNNPKIAARNSKATRFDEMAIIEENELKRGIAERIREIRGEAELKKLKDDFEIIEEKGGFSRFIGFFTGQNKLDDFMIEQIEIRQVAIRRTLSKNMSLAYNYSIHELMAEIQMFILENEDDELIEDDVNELKNMADELRKNFIILESKVQNIIEDKDGKNLPLENKKISKMDRIEIETYRFLNKYGYDLASKTTKEEPKYQDTMASEISRVVEYINSAKIL